MDHDELVKKVDLALSDLTSAGLLNPEQNDRFIRTMIDQPTILRDVRTVPMSSPTMKINKIQFGSRILKVAPQSGDGATDDGANTRILDVADRSVVTTSQIELNTKEVMAEVHLHDEVLEDNIERGNLTNTILDLIAERAALDLEEMIITGDGASGDPFLALHDGILKRATSNVVDAAGASISADLFNDMLKALPTQFRRNRNLMRFYTSMDVEQDYRLALSNRGTPLGDNVLTGTQAVPVFGVPIKGVALMPNANMFFTNPQNIIWGIQRNIRIERDRNIRARTNIIVVTARIALQIEEELAVVKLTNLG